MAVRLDKPWQAGTREALAAIRGQLGVFELADEAGERIFIGYAGGRSLFGLGGEIRQAFSDIPDAHQFRLEITTAYATRYRELLMACMADEKALPRANDASVLQGLGRLSPL